MIAYNYFFFNIKPNHSLICLYDSACIDLDYTVNIVEDATIVSARPHIYYIVFVFGHIIHTIHKSALIFMRNLAMIICAVFALFIGIIPCQVISTPHTHIQTPVRRPTTTTTATRDISTTTSNMRTTYCVVDNHVNNTRHRSHIYRVVDFALAHTHI